MKRIFIRMTSGDVFMTKDVYPMTNHIADELNDDRTKYIAIGGFVCQKEKVDSVSVEEERDGTDKD